MSTRVITYQVDFKANTTGVKNALTSLKQDLNSITSLPIRLDDGQVTKTINNVKQLQQHLKAATDVDTGKLDLTKFSAQLKKSNTDLKTYANSLNSLGTQGQIAFLKLAQSIAASQTPLRRTNALMANLWTTMKNTMRWQLTSTVLTGFTSALSNAVGFVKELNASLSKIRVVSGQSAKQMELFAEKANKAAKALSTTTTAYTDAALIYYQQGLKGDEVEKRTEATIKMANVTGEAAEAVSSYMTAVWNNFDNGAKTLEYYADAMTALGAATASSTAEIATGLEKFAGIANTVGLSYEYATASLATLVAQTRQSPEAVGTALKTVFSRLQGLKLGETLDDGTNLNKYSEALATVGVQIKDQNGQLKDMDQILDELGQRWNFISKDQQMALAQTVGGVRQYTQLITLMSNYDKFKVNVDIATNAEGTLNEQNAIFEQSWAASAKRVKASLETIYSSLIDDKAFVKLNDLLSGLIDSFGGFIKGIGGVGPILTMAFGTLATKLVPKLISGAGNFVHNFKIFSGENTKVEQSMVNQAEKLLRSQGIIQNTNTNYEKIKANTLEIIKLEQTRLQFGKSITKEQEDKINKAKEELQVQNQILETEGKIQAKKQAYIASKVNDVIYDTTSGAAKERFVKDPGKVAAMTTGAAELFGANQLGALLDKVGLPTLSNTLAVNFTDNETSVDPREVGIINETMEANPEKLNWAIDEKLGQVNAAFGMANVKANFGQDKDGAWKLGLDENYYNKEQFEKLYTSKDAVNAAAAAVQTAAKEGKPGEVEGLMTEFEKVLRQFMQEYTKAANTQSYGGGSLIKSKKEREQIAKEGRNFGEKQDVPLTPSQQKEEEIKELNNKISTETTNKQIAVQSSVQGVTSALTNMYMMMSAIQSLGSIWNNDDLTFAEKFTSTLMSFSMLMPAITGGLKAFKQIKDGLTTSHKASTAIKEAELAIDKLQQGQTAANTTTTQAEIVVNEQEQNQTKENIGLNGAEFVSEKMVNKEKQKGIMVDNVKGAAEDRNNGKKKKSIFFNMFKGVSEAFSRNWVEGLIALVPAIGILAMIGMGGFSVFSSISKGNKEKQDKAAQKSIENYKETREENKEKIDKADKFQEEYKAYKETGLVTDKLKEATLEAADALEVTGAHAAILADDFDLAAEKISEASTKVLEDALKAGNAALASAGYFINNGLGNKDNITFDVGLGLEDEQAFRQLYEKDLVASADDKLFGSTTGIYYDPVSGKITMDNTGTDEQKVERIKLLKEMLGEVSTLDPEHYMESELYINISKLVNDNEDLIKGLEAWDSTQEGMKADAMSALSYNTEYADDKKVGNYKEYLALLEEIKTDSKYSILDEKDIGKTLSEQSSEFERYEKTRLGLLDLEKQYFKNDKERLLDIYYKYGDAIFSTTLRIGITDEEIERQIEYVQEQINANKNIVTLNARLDAKEELSKLSTEEFAKKYLDPLKDTYIGVSREVWASWSKSDKENFLNNYKNTGISKEINNAKKSMDSVISSYKIVEKQVYGEKGLANTVKNLAAREFNINLNNEKLRANEANNLLIKRLNKLEDQEKFIRDSLKRNQIELKQNQEKQKDLTFVNDIVAAITAIENPWLMPINSYLDGWLTDQLDAISLAPLQAEETSYLDQIESLQVAMEANQITQEEIISALTEYQRMLEQLETMEKDFQAGYNDFISYSIEAIDKTETLDDFIKLNSYLTDEIIAYNDAQEYLFGNLSNDTIFGKWQFIEKTTSQLRELVNTSDKYSTSVIDIVENLERLEKKGVKSITAVKDAMDDLAKTKWEVDTIEIAGKAVNNIGSAINSLNEYISNGGYLDPNNLSDVWPHLKTIAESLNNYLGSKLFSEDDIVELLNKGELQNKFSNQQYITIDELYGYGMEAKGFVEPDTNAGSMATAAGNLQKFLDPTSKLQWPTDYQQKISDFFSQITEGGKFSIRAMAELVRAKTTSAEQKADWYPIIRTFAPNLMIPEDKYTTNADYYYLNNGLISTESELYKKIEAQQEDYSHNENNYIKIKIDENIPDQLTDILLSRAETNATVDEDYSADEQNPGIYINANDKEKYLFISRGDNVKFEDIIESIRKDSIEPGLSAYTMTNPDFFDKYFTDLGGANDGIKPENLEKIVKRYTAQYNDINTLIDTLDNYEIGWLDQLMDSNYSAADTHSKYYKKQIGILEDQKKQIDDWIENTSTDNLKNAANELGKWMGRSTLKGIELEFDDNGRVINADQIKQAYEHAQAEATNADKQAQLKEEEGLISEAISYYNEILNDLEMANKFVLQKIAEINEKTLLKLDNTYTNVFKALERNTQVLDTQLSWLDELPNKNYERIETNIDRARNFSTEYTKNESLIRELEATGLENQAERDKYEEALNKRLELRTSLLNTERAIIEEIGMYLEEHLETIDKLYNRYDSFNTLLESYKEILNIIGKDSEEYNKAALDLVDTQIKNAQKQVSVSKQISEEVNTEYEAIKEKYANILKSGDEFAIAYWKQQVELAEEKATEAAERFRETWTNALNLIKERYDLLVEQMAAKYEDELSPRKTLEEANDLHEKNLEVQERYISNEKKLYELNKLERELNREISKNPTVLAQQKLLSVQKTITEFKNKEIKLTNYQLEKLQKIYDLRVAEIALEEARNNKSEARLVRDSQGNWNYVFTTNQEKIDQAAQKVEDARYALFEHAEAQEKTTTENLFDIQRRFLEDIKKLDPASETYEEDLERITKFYSEQYAYWLTTLQEVTQDLNKPFEETLFAQIDGSTSAQAAMEKFANSVNSLSSGMLNEQKELYKGFNNIFSLIGEENSIENFPKIIKEVCSSVGKDITETTSLVTSELEKMSDGFGKVIKTASGFNSALTKSSNMWQALEDTKTDQKKLVTKEVTGEIEAKRPKDYKSSSLVTEAAKNEKTAIETAKNDAEEKVKENQQRKEQKQQDDDKNREPIYEEESDKDKLTVKINNLESLYSTGAQYTKNIEDLTSQKNKNSGRLLEANSYARWYNNSYEPLIKVQDIKPYYDKLGKDKINAEDISNLFKLTKENGFQSFDVFFKSIQESKLDLSTIIPLLIDWYGYNTEKDLSEALKTMYVEDFSVQSKINIREKYGKYFSNVITDLKDGKIDTLIEAFIDPLTNTVDENANASPELRVANKLYYYMIESGKRKLYADSQQTKDKLLFLNNYDLNKLNQEKMQIESDLEIANQILNEFIQKNGTLKDINNQIDIEKNKLKEIEESSSQAKSSETPTDNEKETPKESSTSNNKSPENDFIELTTNGGYTKEGYTSKGTIVFTPTSSIGQIFGGKYVKVTSLYGNRVLNGKDDWHKGVDLVPCDENGNTLQSKDDWGIYSLVDGKIFKIQSINNGGYGKFVEVLGNDGYIYRYSHLGEVTNATIGESVVAGVTKLGVMGRSGSSYGNHLDLTKREAIEANLAGITKDNVNNPLELWGFDTGGYTGDWNSSEGKLAVLHEKELILNKQDTKNMLSAIELLRGMSLGIAEKLLGAASYQLSALSNAFTTSPIQMPATELTQNVHIEASFPGVQSAFEIETALNNIINDVSQYAEIKQF